VSSLERLQDNVIIAVRDCMVEFGGWRNYPEDSVIGKLSIALRELDEATDPWKLLEEAACWHDSGTSGPPYPPGWMDKVWSMIKSRANRVEGEDES
jgi:hypothetical protein